MAVVGRTKDVLERAAKDLTECGSPDALGLVADTTDAGQVQRVFDELSERWHGELNALINAVSPLGKLMWPGPWNQTFGSGF